MKHAIASKLMIGMALLVLVVLTGAACASPEVTPTATETTDEQESAAPKEEAKEATAPPLGHVEGHVLYKCNRQPAAGYYVYVFPGGEGTAYTTVVVEVDENGRYRFAQPPGTYRLTADEKPDTIGFAYTHSTVEVSAGATTVAEDILVWFCPDLELISPADGAVVATARPTFKWEPCAGAIAYRVRVQAESGRLYNFPPKDTEPPNPPAEGTRETVTTTSDDLPPGEYEWYVEAYDDISAIWTSDMLGRSHRWRFTIIGAQ